MQQSSTPEFFSPSVTQQRRFFLDLAPPADQALAVVCGGYERCSPEYAIDRKNFPYFSIELVEHGSGQVALDGVTYQLSAGSVFAYGPGVTHRIRTDRKARLRKYFVNFTGVESTRLLESAGLSLAGYAMVAPVAEVQVLFNELLRDGATNDSLSGPMCSALLRSLCLRISAYQVNAATNQSESYRSYQLCVAHIDKNAKRLTSVAQVAFDCGLDPSYLARLFKRHGRQTPYQYLTRVRMNLAAEILLDSALPVAEVANSMGCDDPFHFSRSFKSTFGVSPTVFRTLR